MDSVYFGKETDRSATPLQAYYEKQPRVYYFPDENSRKLKVHSFFNSFFGSAVFDIVIFILIFPVAVGDFNYVIPMFNFVENELIYVVAAAIVYIPLFLIIYLVIHNAFRRKVYVYDNRTIYVIKLRVRVKTFKKGIFTSRENAEKRIHERYAYYIARIDNLIYNKSSRIKKVLTDCRESIDITDKGITYTGFNEKKVDDEEIIIPSHYMKYDPQSSYFSKRTLQKAMLLFCRLTIYGIGAAFILVPGIRRLNIFERDFDSFRDSKTAVLEPLGLEYNEDRLYDHRYLFLDYTDSADDYLKNSVRIYFDVDDQGIRDGGIFIDYDMYYDDDYSIVKDILNGLYPDLAQGTAYLDEAVEEYLDDPDSEIRKTYSRDRVYMTVNVRESYFADYKIGIYITKVGLFEKH